MAGHSRSEERRHFGRLLPAISLRLAPTVPYRDRRDKPGDDGESVAFNAMLKMCNGHAPSSLLFMARARQSPFFRPLQTERDGAPGRRPGVCETPLASLAIGQPRAVRERAHPKRWGAAPPGRSIAATAYRRKPAPPSPSRLMRPGTATTAPGN